ncbi:hypothetical protein K493DRAFT_362429 [Basidiobolus meristosporus CBS 931.73]|uniref:Yeast cell wall synthesis Kre9/Knh1-like N-terminal domain-containing protein n=1 Tax=Basidiobolus meristosporus CBS 931.73 TaxID=1314790 RepID=A0A1Y1X2U2_9FUNG|nr:hypothetical protein K493DRAFT_362429 [Basidiobolus meristosporus CBS 931.73]|eukprot:ORX79948.1 hypothetical protein K493DRAFT_362429 [Basidiobolus meristosporus CBS 931.73]
MKGTLNLDQQNNQADGRKGVSISEFELNACHFREVSCANQEEPSSKADLAEAVEDQTETGEGPPAPASFPLDLMQGPATGLQLVQSITKEADTKEGQYNWAIPETLPPGNYSVRAGTPPNVVYSTYFEIKGPGSGGVSSTPAPPPPAPPKSSKKPEKGSKKSHPEDKAKKSSAPGSSSSISTATTSAALPPGTPSAIPITVQKSTNATTPADHKTTPPGASDQKGAQPSGSSVSASGGKKSHENVATVSKAQFVGLVVCAALGSHFYLH